MAKFDNDCARITAHSLIQGSPIAFLPIIHHALMNFSLPLARWLDEEGYEMFGKNDLRFIESLYKVII